MTSPVAFTSIILLVAAALAILVIYYRRDQRLRRTSRGALFAPSYDLFESYRVTQERSDYPVLTGRYRNHDFQIDAIVDTLTFRKIPVLWLRVTLLRSLPGIAATDILVRVQNNEFYSPANDLPFQLPVPGHWPPGAVAKTEDAEKAPPLDLLERHIDFFAAIEAKEMLVTPKGVRLVRLIDQGTRADYMVLRIADFRRVNLEPALLSDMMDRTIALADDIGRGITEQSP
ncbi:hypothetical protein [Dongia sp.]|uniref:hypothetical protein n=1 Tax=Dongia sp. TaxID=1977262 RepID=UPI0035B19802